jgi:Raf kinase inhibitor-like YbhB/YbcL family protein
MIAVAAVCLGLSLVTVGCSAEGKLASNSELSGGLWGVSLTSTAFKSMEVIPEKYTQDGTNVSPPLKWSKGPSGVKEWVLIVEDADHKADDKDRPAVHWAVFKIPGNVTELPEGASRNMTHPQGKNYLGESGYAGPKLQGDKPHRYFFQIFALDTVQNLPAGADREMVKKNLQGYVLSKGQLVGMYPAPKE